MCDASCPTAAPKCNCPANTICRIVPFDGCKCASVECTPVTTGSTKNGPGAGAVAGAVVGIVIFAVICGLAYFFWRRRVRTSAASEKSLPVITRDVPANPDAVLSRPDPQEKHLSALPAAMPATPQSPTHLPLPVGDPFSDHASIQTASARTHSPNVITIGLIPPPDGLQPMPASPRRPERAPDLVLRDQPVENSLKPPTARFAKRMSVGTAITQSSVASSAFSTASSTMSILTEEPQIMAVRQAVGVSKAEVVQVSPNATPTSTLHPLRGGRSPLSMSSYGPEDIPERHAPNPFSDHGHGTAASSASSIRSTSTFGQSTPTQWQFPPTAWQDGGSSRPTSIQSTTSGVVTMGSATRVVFAAPFSTATGPTPPVPPMPSTLQIPGSDTDSERRVSHQSQHSVASSRAESILDAFPFVPPSPIAARPPRSPLGMTFTPPSPAKSAQNFALQQQQQQQQRAAAAAAAEAGGDLPPPRAVRVSTMSASSGLSGLGDYTFRFQGSDGPPGIDANGSGRRASLDTLALSRDVEAFPLSTYDDPLRQGMPHEKH